ncbi:MAG: hypothetical protein WCR42_14630 [bacterium]
MYKVLSLFALLLILTFSPSAESGAVVLEPVRITVTSSTPNTDLGATLTIDLLNPNGTAFDDDPVSIVRNGEKTNLGGVLSFVLDEPAWCAPLYNPNYLVRVTYGGVVLSIERLEVVYAKQGLFGAYVESEDMDPEATVTTTTSAVAKLTPGNTINGVLFDGSEAITIPAEATTLTGIVAPNQGGTGLSSYTKGDIIYADDVSTLANLHDVATGNALISGGVGIAPSWGKIDLTSHTDGILPVSKGGTGQATYTNGQLLIGNTDENTLTKAELTAGKGIAIENGNGSIKIAANFVPQISRLIASTNTSAFVVPEGVSVLTIEAVGGSGGGGGSGADMNSGGGATGGGGGGGAGEHGYVILSVSPGDVIGVSIGAKANGGAFGNNSKGGDGDPGVATTVTHNTNIVLTANGGMGGIGSPGNSYANGSSGGAGSVGGAGGTGIAEAHHLDGASGLPGTNSTSTVAGSGGTGGDGPSVTGTTTNKGGAGGAGAYNSGATRSGNAGLSGTPGTVIITYTYE